MKILVIEDDEFNQAVISEMTIMLYPEVTVEIVENGKRHMKG